MIQVWLYKMWKLKKNIFSTFKYQSSSYRPRSSMLKCRHTFICNLTTNAKCWDSSQDDYSDWFKMIYSLSYTKSSCNVSLINSCIDSTCSWLRYMYRYPCVWIRYKDISYLIPNRGQKQPSSNSHTLVGICITLASIGIWVV